MTSVTKEDELEIYKRVLKGHRQSDIAKDFHITQGYVSHIYSKIIKQNDSKLAVSSALEFIAEYQKQYDYLTMKQQELEQVLEQAEQKDKSKIIMDQVSVSQIILHNVSQRKFMQAIQEDTHALQAYLHTLPDDGVKELEDTT